MLGAMRRRSPLWLSLPASRTPAVEGSVARSAQSTPINFRQNGCVEDRGVRPWLAGIERGQVTPLIESDERVIRVQAGPGTGKTLGIRRRVLRLLHPEGLNVDPDRVLVCAFNRAIARDLVTEIKAELDPHGLPLPHVKTIHALCSEIARTDARFLLPHEVEEMVYDVRQAHATLREEYARHSDAMRAVREHEAGLASHPALAQAVRAWLVDHGAALVGDSPRNVERAMAAGEVPHHLYDHVIVDEFQDLTTTEAQVVTKLRSERRCRMTRSGASMSCCAWPRG